MEVNCQVPGELEGVWVMAVKCLAPVDEEVEADVVSLVFPFFDLLALLDQPGLGL